MAEWRKLLLILLRIEKQKERLNKMLSEIQYAIYMDMLFCYNVEVVVYKIVCVVGTNLIKVPLLNLFS